MTRRWPALVLIVALLVGGTVLVEGGDAGDDGDAPADPASLLPVAAPEDARDTAWFCAGQTAGDDTTADGTVVIANVGDEEATGHLEVVSDAGERAEAEVEVPALTTRRIRVADVLEADWAAVRVETRGGTVVVEHEVEGPLGRDAAPCHTTAAGQALLPSGATTRDATLHLAIYNPFPESATVDVSFDTSDTLRRRPSDFQGLPVPARSLIVLDVTPVVTVVPVAAATVTTRRGRVVVDRIQTYDGEGASTTAEEAAEEAYEPEGLTLTPALPGPQAVWAFPVGSRGATVHERVVIRNPTEEQAEVDVEVTLDDPERNGTVGPFPVTVAPGEFAVFDLDEGTSMPDGVPHTLVVRSTNGVPVVAERWIDTAGEEANYLGVATSTGSPVAALRWAFAAGRRPADEEWERIVVLNPGRTGVEVAVVSTGEGEAVPAPDGRTTLGPGERWELDLGAVEGDGFSIVVEATGPVVAERRLMSRGSGGGEDEEREQGRGASVSLGVPLPPGLVLLG